MKTLKQIREEYNDKFMSQVEVLPEELMLEKSVIPSTKEMPAVIVFRRVSFRSYPKGQVVALYYSKVMDKYLSIPIGPDNVNLSEACWKGYEQVGMKKKGNREVPNCVPVKEDGPGNPSYTTRPTYESFKERVEKLREEKLEENPLIGLSLRALGSTGLKDLAKKGLKMVGKALVGDDEKDDDKKEKSDDKNEKPVSQTQQKHDATAKVSSSWENKPTSDPVYQSKAKQAAIAPIKENKITDIRTMIKEGIDNMDLSINGRQVTLNTSMAKRILEVYDSVNTKNKKIVEGMLNEDLESFKKLLNFSIRN